jgi:hypothetical protein
MDQSGLSLVALLDPHLRVGSQLSTLVLWAGDTRRPTQRISSQLKLWRPTSARPFTALGSAA